MFEREKHKILMVEDNSSNHELFTDVFMNEDFSVTIIPFIDEGFIDDVARIKPDIISMDIMLDRPGIELPYDGLAGIALLKADDRTKDIPVMILTNFFEEGKVDRAKRAGAVDYINLQGHSISTIPKIFKRYLDDPKNYHPGHPIFMK